MLTQGESPRMIRYESWVMSRAQRSVLCSPFEMPLLVAMQQHGVSLKAIAGNNGTSQGYTSIPLTEARADTSLMWLLRTGVLRREVDGQGLTDSFRLTPLGRQLVELWEKNNNSLGRPSWFDYARDALSRWLRLPDWLQ